MQSTKLSKPLETQPQNSFLYKPEDHLRFVAHQVRKLHFCTPNNFDDLFQVGAIGLIKACRRADGRHDHRTFLTFAALHIRGEIMHYHRSLLGRKEKGINRTKPHVDAVSLSLKCVPDPIYECEPTLCEDREAMRVAFNSAWEKTPQQRKYIELVFVQGLTKKKAAECCGVHPMVVARNIKDGLLRLAKAYKEAIGET